MNNPNIGLIFSQFVYVRRLDVDLEKITKYCYHLKNMGKVSESQNSNLGGWHSSYLSHTDVEKQYFLNEIQAALDDIKESLDFRFKLFINNVWVNINPRHALNVNHLHPGSLLSGVLYVKTNPESGRIIFRNPSGYLAESYLHYFHLTSGVDLPSNELFSHAWGYQPENGSLLIFPSWLEHYAQPNQSDEDRIVISFNTAAEKYSGGAASLSKGISYAF